MSRYLRYLRIAFSAFCGLACVLLIVLWARSYWFMDSVVVPISNTHSFGLFWALGRVGPEIEVGYSHLQCRTSELTPADVGRWTQLARFGFAFGKNERGAFVIFPFWLAALFSAGLGAAPWLKWSGRF